MERRLPDGSKNVTRGEYTTGFTKPINVRVVPPLNFGANGVMVLNPLDQDDAAILAECKLWLEQGDDPRIDQFGIHIQEGGAVEPPPIPRYENYKVQVLVKRIEDEVDLIGGDNAEARAFLESVARYELQRDKPRKMVLDSLESLGSSTGVESGLDEIEESD
jgi:hypothetical protein